MITLAFDTATPAPALALLRGAEPLLERTLPADRGAGRRVAEEIHVALGDAGLDVRDVSRIVVGVGPGGFTGLRIGIATALALGQALGVPVVGVSTLETLALGMAGDAPAGGLLVPVIDAKRQEVFTAAYRALGDGRLDVVAEPRAATVAGMADLLAAVASAGDPAWLAGDGLSRCAELSGPAARPLPPDAEGHAVNAVMLAKRVDAGGALPVAPVYLRLPDAEVNRLRGLAQAAPA